MKTLITICLVVMIVFSLCATGNATILGTVDIVGHNNSLSDQSPLYGGGLAGGNYYTGIYSFTNAGGTGLGTSVPDWGFCIELPQGTADGWADVMPLEETPIPAQYGTPMGAAKADYIRELWGRYFDSSWLTSPGNKDAEAFSAALWEIVYETDPSWDVTAGLGFQAPGIENAANANAWLASLNGDKSWFAPNLVSIAKDDRQDFLVQIPEPATIAMLGLGTLLFLRKRRA